MGKSTEISPSDLIFRVSIPSNFSNWNAFPKLKIPLGILFNKLFGIAWKSKIGMARRYTLLHCRLLDEVIKKIVEVVLIFRAMMWIGGAQDNGEIDAKLVTVEMI